MKLEEITTIINCIATVLSLVIATIALIQSNKQTRLTNKQHLFDERIRIYLIIKGLLELYKINKDSIEEKKEDRIYFEVDFMFLKMINNSYLENISEVIYKPLHNPEQRTFLKKLQELKNEATKIKFIFDGEICPLLERFVFEYQNFLMNLYQYKVLLEDMNKFTKEIPNTDIEKAAKDAGEKKHRERLFEAFNNLSNSYKILDTYTIEKELESQIKLIQK